jgi:hypothetical protein
MSIAGRYSSHILPVKEKNGLILKHFLLKTFFPFSAD